MAECLGAQIASYPHRGRERETTAKRVCPNVIHTTHTWINIFAGTRVYHADCLISSLRIARQKKPERRPRERSVTKMEQAERPCTATPPDRFGAGPVYEPPKETRAASEAKVPQCSESPLSAVRSQALLSNWMRCCCGHAWWSSQHTFALRRQAVIRFANEGFGRLFKIAHIARTTDPGPRPFSAVGLPQRRTAWRGGAIPSSTCPKAGQGLRKLRRDPVCNRHNAA